MISSCESDCLLFDDAFVMISDNNMTIGNYNCSKFLSMFHSLDYTQLRSVLVGVRTLIQSKSTCTSKSEIIHDIFPELNKPQQQLVASLTDQDFIDLVYFLGYQLASEGYLYSDHDVHLKFPISNDSAKQFRNQIYTLAKKTGFTSAVDCIDSFIEDVLIFYFNQLVTRDPDESITSFLETSNFCDATDPIFATISAEVSIKHYVSLRQELHQARLFLLLSCKDAGVGDKLNSSGKDSSLTFNDENWMLLDQLENTKSLDDETPENEKEESLFWYEDVIVEDVESDAIEMEYRDSKTSEQNSYTIVEESSEDVNALLDFIQLNENLSEHELDTAASCIQAWWRYCMNSREWNIFDFDDDDNSGPLLDTHVDMAATLIQNWWRKRKQQR